MSILVDGQRVDFHDQDFPLLISGQEGSGASYFSVGLMVNLFRQGRKIVFFTAFPAAKEEFKKALTEKELQEVEFIDRGDHVLGRRAIVIRSGEEADFIEVMQQLQDVNDRVVLVKNMENYSVALFDQIKDKKSIVLSGDIDKCAFFAEIKNQRFSTVIFFSQPAKYPIDHFRKLKKYQGMIVSQRYHGIIGLE